MYGTEHCHKVLLNLNWTVVKAGQSLESAWTLKASTESQGTGSHLDELTLAKGGERKKRWFCKYVTGTHNREKYVNLQKTGDDKILSAEI